MQIQIVPGDGLPIYLQIKSQVKYLVASGSLQAGEKLPAVRKLAETLLVNPNTVQRAYRELESEGVVETRRGAGVFVQEMLSPLAESEKKRILAERIDALLTEASQMNFSKEQLNTLINQRYEVMQND